MINLQNIVRPNLQGGGIEITLKGSIKLSPPGYGYKEDIDYLVTKFTIENIPQLSITADGYYIKFEDPEISRICIENFSTDGIACTENDLKLVTTTATSLFEDNTLIEKFNEFKYFTGVTNIFQKHIVFNFENCINLKEIEFPSSLTYIYGDNFGATYHGCFQNTALKNINLKNVKSVHGYTFNNCPLNDLSTGTLDLSGVTQLGRNAFGAKADRNYIINEVKFANGSNYKLLQGWIFQWRKITKGLYVPPGIDMSLSDLASSAFSGAVDTYIEFPEDWTIAVTGCSKDSIICLKRTEDTTTWVREQMSSYADWGMKALILFCKIPPAITGNIWSRGKSCPIYVPDESVDLYKAATYWKDYTIKPLSSQTWSK